jgi:hypothetical protein
MITRFALKQIIAGMLLTGRPSVQKASGMHGRG